MLLAALRPALLLAGSIDAAHSELVIHVGKAGMFSAIGHEPWVDAPIARGEVREGASAGVDFTVEARAMAVRADAKTSAKELAIIQDTMQRTVLESGAYPEIRFQSTQVAPAGAQAWKVTGTLTLHGVSQAVTADVRREGDTYAGATTLRQTDFGIQPVRIAGGVVRVKDQLEIRFKIRAHQGN